MIDLPADPRRRRKFLRIATCVWIAAVATAVSWVLSAQRTQPSDLAQAWVGARTLLDGGNPYDVVGPGREFEWEFPLLYPMPAILAVVPLSFLPLRVADAVFMAFSAGLLAWGLTRAQLFNPQLLVFGSVACYFVLLTSQWSLLIVASALVPTFGALVACKPTIGLAMLAAYPSRRAVVGAAVFLGASTLAFPWWPRAWLSTLGAATHITAPMVQFGGPLLLLAGLKWRRPEARLLLALALVPHTPAMHEAIPLFLVANRLREAVTLCLLTLAVPLIVGAIGPFATYNEWMAASARWMVWLLYLPCLAVVLTRPNRRQDCSPLG